MAQAAGFSGPTPRRTWLSALAVPEPVDESLKRRRRRHAGEVDKVSQEACQGDQGSVSAAVLPERQVEFRRLYGGGWVDDR